MRLSNGGRSGQRQEFQATRSCPDGQDGRTFRRSSGPATGANEVAERAMRSRTLGIRPVQALRRQVEHLRDAADQARAAGMSLPEISTVLRVDVAFLRRLKQTVPANALNPKPREALTAGPIQETRAREYDPATGTGRTERRVLGRPQAGVRGQARGNRSEPSSDGCPPVPSMRSKAISGRARRQRAGVRPLGRRPSMVTSRWS